MTKGASKTYIRKGHFPALQLPAELRHRIYYYCLTSDNGKPVHIGIPKEKVISNLVYVCRQVYMESLDLFYNNNTLTCSSSGFFVQHLSSDALTKGARRNLKKIHHWAFLIDLKDWTRPEKFLAFSTLPELLTSYRWKNKAARLSLRLEMVGHLIRTHPTRWLKFARSRTKRILVTWFQLTSNTKIIIRSGEDDLTEIQDLLGYRNDIVGLTLLYY